MAIIVENGIATEQVQKTLEELQTELSSVQSQIASMTNKITAVQDDQAVLVAREAELQAAITALQP